MAERVTVVVATYNREEMLVDTIKDLVQQDYPDFEVLVIDQTPDHLPDVAAFLTEFGASGRGQWIRTDKPGLTRARNIGLQRATGSYIIYVDDDVRIPDAKFIQHHVDALSRPGVGAAAGRVLEPDRPPLTVDKRVGWLGYFGTREPGFGTERSGAAESVRGCNMSFVRSVLSDIGGFDEAYTRSAYREDTDVAFRVKRAGYQLWFSAEAWLYHLSSPQGGTRDRTIPVAEDVILNDVRFARKNLGFVQRSAWLARLYGSRVLKAGIKAGGLKDRHAAFRAALTMTRGERRRLS
ncbi:glycosyltransferase family 2 protein [Sulfobacillus harzensis]|uniref:Glycosyltransferase family 2 protein n=1 Tax=Sulfobacillus harzensis TaxID=2729629 RepID=A0A7Y0Q2N7_9FIRM|nr:glycosyltransferase [Sulfobacillus harzensis]NMP22535.1 glycosyltransferase family 2 protein [Sulfobacillus harzensis]